MNHTRRIATVAAALEQQIRDGSLTLHATHADDDWVAPWGRKSYSEHPIDPRTIGEANEDATGQPEIFSSNGGWVEDYGTPEGEYGERTEGHNAQRSTELIYTVDGVIVVPTSLTSPSPLLLFPVYDDGAVGYLDPASQSYKQAVVDHVDAILAEQEQSE